MKALEEHWGPGMLALAGNSNKALEAWFDEALDRVSDRRFGESFAAGCPVPGLGPEAYQHRILEGSPSLLAGIRFKGGDLNQPFVELLAWSHIPEDWSSVVDRINEAFAPFQPKFFRLRWPGQARPPFSKCQIDQSLLAARMDQMRDLARPAAWGQLRIEPVQDLDWLVDFQEAFAAWQKTAGALAGEVTALDEEGFQECLETGRVVCAWHEGQWAGVAAAVREAEQALDGFCVYEEFLALPFQGKRLGPCLQRKLIESLPADEVLWGTIHADNTPSLRTALSCGRQVVETWWFVDCCQS